MIRMGLPRARNEEVDVEEVAHDDSSRIAFTVAVVILGAPAGATSTGRPNSPRTSRALRRDSRSSTSRPPSSVTCNESPGRRFIALRYRLGITNWPFVDSFAVLIAQRLTRLTTRCNSSAGAECASTDE